MDILQEPPKQKGNTMKKSIKLDVPQRLELTTIISSFGYNRALLGQAEEMLKKISFTAKEIELYGITSSLTQTSWTNNKEISFEFPEDVVKKIMAHFDKLLDTEKMTLHLKPLYDKFEAYQRKE